MGMSPPFTQVPRPISRTPCTLPTKTFTAGTTGTVTLTFNQKMTTTTTTTTTTTMMMIQRTTNRFSLLYRHAATAVAVDTPLSFSDYLSPSLSLVLNSVA